MKSISVEFGINVKNRRLELGMSQQKLAEECDFDRGTIVLIEKGQSNSTLNTISTLADVLDVHPSDLLKTD
ncbi:helix-turn-helix transcriptional regulator [Peribacillus sp. FSL P2-0133]|uniref:helix-turn-helix domain-containing protein n=1 Tax=Peribacillus sp. FSL P2-0133 TaxID=2921573 RepID=UPI0030CAA4A3